MIAGMSPFIKWVKGSTDDKFAELAVTGQDTSLPGVAVLRITPNVPFQIGWRPIDNDRAAPEYYGEPVKTDAKGQLAMRVGIDGVRFVAKPTDNQTDLKIELVEVATEDKPEYKDTPWY